MTYFTKDLAERPSTFFTRLHIVLSSQKYISNWATLTILKDGNRFRDDASVRLFAFDGSMWRVASHNVMTMRSDIVERKFLHLLSVRDAWRREKEREREGRRERMIRRYDEILTLLPRRPWLKRIPCSCHWRWQRQDRGVSRPRPRCCRKRCSSVPRSQVPPGRPPPAPFPQTLPQNTHYVILVKSL